MRNFLRQAYYTYRGLFTWLSLPSYVTTVVLGPALTIIMFALVGRFALGPDVVRPYVLGLVAQYIPFIISAGIMNCFSHEIWGATLSTVYASRGNRTVVFFSRQLLHIPNGLMITAAGLFFGWLFLDLDFVHVSWTALIMAVLAISLSSCAAAAFVGNMTIVMTDWILMYRIFSGALLVLTGVIIPISSLPTPLAAVSQVLPLTHGLVVFRSAFDGAGLPTLWFLLIEELAVAAGYVVLGVAGYYLVERFAKRRGILETVA
jgi:ABC-type polysaccharide/polyol phosphate export permease